MYANGYLEHLGMASQSFFRDARKVIHQGCHFRTAKDNIPMLFRLRIIAPFSPQFTFRPCSLPESRQGACCKDLSFSPCCLPAVGQHCPAAADEACRKARSVLCIEDWRAFAGCATEDGEEGLGEGPSRVDCTGRLIFQSHGWGCGDGSRF